MKQTLLSVILMLLSLAASADEVKIDGIWYFLYSNNKKAEVTRDPELKPYVGDIKIPNSVEYEGIEYDVVEISNYAFYGSEELTSIEIPDKVSVIGNTAFGDCRKLTEIILPNSLTEIQSQTFSGCEALKSIIIPDNIIKIEDGAFQGCISLTTLKLPNKLTHIGSCAFSGCNSLSTLTIPSSVKEIGDWTFQSCYNLSEIVVEEDNLVYDSRNNCNAIIETSTNKLLLGSSNTIIPEGIISICKNAFPGPSGLKSIVIPQSVISIEPGAFYECSNMESVIVKEGNPIYDSRDNCNAIIETSSNKLIYGCKNTIIPNTVSIIGEYAFYGNSAIISMNIPNSVNEIESQAFEECSNMNSIYYGNGLKKIGWGAFSWTGFSSLSFPEGVEEIGGYICCPISTLTKVVIPSTMKTIGRSAFQGCSQLTDFYCYVENIIDIDYSNGSKYDNVFYDVNIDNITLHVPAGSLDAYKTDKMWGQFKNIVAIDPNKTSEDIICEDGFVTVPMEQLALYSLDYQLQEHVKAGKLQAKVTPKNTYWTLSCGVDVLIPEGVSIFKCQLNSTGTSVELLRLDNTELDGILKANNGVLIKGTAGQSYNIIVSPNNSITSISKNDAKSYGTDNQLEPVIESAHFSADNYYVLKYNKFHVIDGTKDTKVPACKAVLKIPAGAAASRSLDIDGEDTTGLFVIEADKNDEWYNLNGQRINLPIKEGLYIKNGKKVIVK